MQSRDGLSPSCLTAQLRGAEIAGTDTQDAASGPAMQDPWFEKCHLVVRGTVSKSI